MSDDKKCGHNPYWVGTHGTCMVCRAEKAEQKLTECLCWKSEHCPLHSVGIAEAEYRVLEQKLRAEKAERENAELRRVVEGMREAKYSAYSERNKLVAALSKLFPASLERHEESDKTWEDDWRWIVFINLPTGQVSWHIQDSELPQFAHLHRICGRVWDGHTTEEKYKRLASLSLTQEGEGRS